MGFNSFLSSRLKKIASATGTMSVTPMTATVSTTSTPPTYLANIMIQFSKQIIRPKVVLPMLLLIILLFDLDGAFNMDDDDLLEFETDDDGADGMDIQDD